MPERRQPALPPQQQPLLMNFQPPLRPFLPVQAEPLPPIMDRRQSVIHPAPSKQQDTSTTTTTTTSASASANPFTLAEDKKGADHESMAKGPKRQKLEHSGNQPLAIENMQRKVTLLLQLAEMISEEMKILRSHNERMEAKIKKMERLLKKNDDLLASLIREDHRAHQQNEHRTQRHSKGGTMLEWLGHSTSTASSALEVSGSASIKWPDLSSSAAFAPYQSSTSSASSSSSPLLSPRSSFSFELSVLQSSVSPATILEAKENLPFLRDYDILPNLFAIINFRYTPSLPSSKRESTTNIRK